MVNGLALQAYANPLNYAETPVLKARAMPLPITPTVLTVLTNASALFSNKLP
jgi:hypothetical protein